MFDLKQRYSSVVQRVAQTCESEGLDATAIRWMAVTKTRSAGEVEAAFNLGVRHVGENYLQEAIDKKVGLSEVPLVWHFIGHIQSNKAKTIAEHFDWVHSVDRRKVIERLAKSASDQGRVLNVCLQLNIDQEIQKSGASIAEVAELVSAVVSEPALCMRGFMVIPQQAENDALRETFDQAHRLYCDYQSQVPTIDTLSMGMSSDLELAIACGANFLRVGTALFGPRG